MENLQNILKLGFNIRDWDGLTWLVFCDLLVNIILTILLTLLGIKLVETNQFLLIWQPFKCSKHTFIQWRPQSYQRDLDTFQKGYSLKSLWVCCVSAADTGSCIFRYLGCFFCYYQLGKGVLVSYLNDGSPFRLI